MEENDAKSRLVQLTSELSSKNLKLRVQLDELVHLARICNGELPEGYHSILREADKSGGFSETSAHQLKDRLVSILQVAEQFPTNTASQSRADSNELSPQFELKLKEKKRILDLCTGMRKIVFASDFFDEPHKKRLLNRIASIESEVHQKTGKLDTVLAGVVDIGDALGKFGRKVEPLTKRMKEVAEIARGGSKQYDQIPPPEEKLGLPPPLEEES